MTARKRRLAPAMLMRAPLRRRWLAWGLLALLLAPLLACSPEQEPGAPEMAPDFELPLLGASEVVSLSGLRGKTVVIDFWATWCPPCEFQVPELNSFLEAHRSEEDVLVYGISIDDGGEELVAKWVSEKSVRYPILLGDDGLARRFGAVGFPTLVVINPDGSVDSRHVGLIEREELEAAVARSRIATSIAAQSPPKPSSGE